MSSNLKKRSINLSISQRLNSSSCDVFWERGYLPAADTPLFLCPMPAVAGIRAQCLFVEALPDTGSIRPGLAIVVRLELSLQHTKWCLHRG